MIATYRAGVLSAHPRGVHPRRRGTGQTLSALPDQLTHDEVQAYLAHRTSTQLAWSSCSQAAHAFRFLYHVTLGHERAQFQVPAPRQPQTLPEILSREEVWRLFNACPRVRDRLLLATTYAAGLRVSEVVHLKVSDLDTDRMTVRIEQGKGARDRYVPLSPRLLKEWRAYWLSTPPRLWLFPNRQGTRPIDITVAQKLYTLTKLRAGIRSRGHPRPAPRLRHASARDGRDVHTVQRLLGHRYVSSTVRYFHLSQGHVLATPSPLDLPEPPAA